MSDISPREASRVILDAFQDFWVVTEPLVPIAFPNIAFDPPEAIAGQNDSDAWVRAFTTGFTDDGHVPLSGSVATNFFRESGRITFEIYTRQGQGLGPAYDLAYKIQGFLDSAARHPDLIIQNRTAAQAVGGDGAWFQVIQAADWLYFTDRVAP